MVINKQYRWIITLSSLMLAGCHSTQTSQAIPEQGLTVSQIYHQSTKEVKPLPRRVVAKPAARTSDKTAFKALPNPSIDLYVFPHVVHIGDETLIKPGYTTAFYFYKSNQYALASELY
jgi:conjugative transfer region lipoprotein (TIGR03751 family)